MEFNVDYASSFINNVFLLEKEFIDATKLNLYTLIIAQKEFSMLCIQYLMNKLDKCAILHFAEK